MGFTLIARLPVPQDDERRERQLGDCELSHILLAGAVESHRQRRQAERVKLRPSREQVRRHGGSAGPGHVAVYLTHPAPW